ncbi:unnamed protein product [marine sediment metagenome]|uniref:16S rRNA (Guanine(966)-N(2))-methyltransferase RsmD n=1 Tax=marine sediment metagenome TaxID=412755 RepID=X1R2X6_9ZZZZ
MRIIAGTKKGMKLLSPPPLLRFAKPLGLLRKKQRGKQNGGGSRPILDRVKESVFSVLYKYDLPAKKIVADLFCGVGSLGLEALSRGADFVCFVENDQEIVTLLKKNIAKAGFVKESKVITANAFKTGAVLGSKKKAYDLFFIDPPYRLTDDVGEKSQLSALFNLLETQAVSMKREIIYYTVV